jgi:hypothetical protein
MLSPADKCSALATDTPGAVPAAKRPATLRDVPRPHGKTRRVLLAATPAVSRDAVRYAVDVCDRLQANLVVMSAFEGTNADASIRRVVEAVRLPGTSWTLMHCNGPDLHCCVRKYVTAHADVMFVVTDASDLTGALGLASPSAGNQRSARQVNVPWVVVSGGRDSGQRVRAVDAA